jgi:hypothetical protein
MFLFPYLVSIQIWLNLSLDDPHFEYFTKKLLQKTLGVGSEGFCKKGQKLGSQQSARQYELGLQLYLGGSIWTTFTLVNPPYLG